MIRVKNLSRSFGFHAVFSGFDLELPEAGAFALTGPSGSGKTTLLRILSGLDTDYEGEADVRGRISYVFQEDRLLPSRTALQNVREVCGSAETASRLLAQTGLSDPRDQKKYPRELSGGMSRRVAIARALAFPHDILLLDEPFTGLDGEVKAKVTELIRTSEQGRLVLLVTHDPEEAEALGCATVRIGNAEA